MLSSRQGDMRDHSHTVFIFQDVWTENRRTSTTWGARNITSKQIIRNLKQVFSKGKLALCTAALLLELQPAPCFLSAIIGQTWLILVCQGAGWSSGSSAAVHKAKWEKQKMGRNYILMHNPIMLGLILLHII